MIICLTKQCGTNRAKTFGRAWPHKLLVELGARENLISVDMDNGLPESYNSLWGLPSSARGAAVINATGSMGCRAVFLAVVDVPTCRLIQK